MKKICGKIEVFFKNGDWRGYPNIDFGTIKKRKNLLMFSEDKMLADNNPHQYVVNLDSVNFVEEMPGLVK